MKNKKNSGNALFYVFMAVGLLAALTYAFVKDSRENFSVQNSVRIADDIFVQSNLIMSMVQQCFLEYPQGGGDMFPVVTPDGVIDTSDNPNTPYPLSPTSANITNAPAGCAATASAAGCIAAAADNTVKNLTCIGAPLGSANIFQGAGGSAFLPNPPSGMGEWEYINDADGVRLQITGSSDPAVKSALDRVLAKFNACQAGLSGTTLTVWIKRNTACP